MNEAISIVAVEQGLVLEKGLPVSQLLDPFSYKKQKVDLKVFSGPFFIEEIDDLGYWGLPSNGVSQLICSQAGNPFHLSPVEKLTKTHVLSKVTTRG